MKTRVRIIKKHQGFTLGAEKDLTLNEAMHLESKGIAEIVKRKSVNELSDAVAILEAKVNKQGKEIAAIKKLLPKK